MPVIGVPLIGVPLHSIGVIGVISVHLIGVISVEVFGVPSQIRLREDDVARPELFCTFLLDFYWVITGSFLIRITGLRSGNFCGFFGILMKNFDVVDAKLILL